MESSPTCPDTSHCPRDPTQTKVADIHTQTPDPALVSLHSTSMARRPGSSTPIALQRFRPTTNPPEYSCLLQVWSLPGSQEVRHYMTSHPLTCIPDPEAFWVFAPGGTTTTTQTTVKIFVTVHLAAWI